MGNEAAGTALIVAREGPSREGCTEMLIAAGLAVRTAADREAALTMFPQGGIDVVVASARDVDGSALLSAIRERDDRLPVIFVTEWPDFSQAQPLTTGSSRGGRSAAEQLRSEVVTAAVSYQVARTRRRP